MNTRPPCSCEDRGGRCAAEGCDHALVNQPYSVDQCRVCWLYWNDDLHNRAWGGPGLGPKRTSQPCRHKGTEVRRQQWATCSGKVELKVFACAVHSECTAVKPADGVKGCCQGCPDYQTPPPPPVAADRKDDPECGVVVGLYRWPKLAELQIRLIRATCGRVPILLSDDCSPEGRWREMELLGEKYADVLVRRNPERIGHAGGDLSAFERGLRWAKNRELAVLAKLSMRMMIEIPYWLQDGAIDLLASGMAASGQPCLEGPHSFPLRSEAVLLNVERMHTPQVLSHWAPRKLHWAAESFAWEAIMMSGGLHPWRVMQQQRMVVDPGIVWHVSAGDEAYHALAGRYGLTLDEDMTAMGNASLQDYVLG